MMRLSVFKRSQAIQKSDMGARIARLGVPLLLTLTHPGSPRAQLSVSVIGGFSIGEGEHFVTYAWNNNSVRTGDTLHLRVVEINASSEPQVPDLVCDITVETELDLVPAEKDCSAGPTPLAPGDSAWTWLTAVIRSPPGEYAFAWELEGNASSAGTFQVQETHEEREAAPGELGDRVPFVLEIVGEEAAFHSYRDIEIVAKEALSKGARGLRSVVFRVDEEAARRMQGFTPVLRLTFEFGEDGEVSFCRCWVGAASTSLLSHLCGGVSSGSFASELMLGVWIHRLLVREGEYLADYVHRHPP